MTATVEGRISSADLALPSDLAQPTTELDVTFESGIAVNVADRARGIREALCLFNKASRYARLESQIEKLQIERGIMLDHAAQVVRTQKVAFVLEGGLRFAEAGGYGQVPLKVMDDMVVGDILMFWGGYIGKERAGEQEAFAQRLGNVLSVYASE